MDEFEQSQFDQLLRQKKELKKELEQAVRRGDKAIFDRGVLLGSLGRMADGVPPIERELMTLDNTSIHTVLQLGINTGLLHEHYVKRIRDNLRARATNGQ